MLSRTCYVYIYSTRNFLVNLTSTYWTFSSDWLLLLNFLSLIVPESSHFSKSKYQFRLFPFPHCHPHSLRHWVQHLYFLNISPVCVYSIFFSTIVVLVQFLFIPYLDHWNGIVIGDMAGMKETNLIFKRKPNDRI